MPAKKKPVTTPLHLLQQLSHSLVAHLHKACSDAQKEAEIVLARIEKQRGKTQEKLVKARARLDEVGNAGKSKAQAKVRAKLAELDDMLGVLQARQSETLSYLAELKRDAAQSLQLAQGVTQVEHAAAQALAARDKPAAARSASRTKAPTRPSGPAAETPSTAMKDASDKAPIAAANARARPSAAARSAAGKPVEPKASAAKAPGTSRRPASASGAPAPAKPGPAAARPATAKKPSTRKPAAAKSEPATQSPSAAS